jgi:3'-phosphoadenosine 5'-phosphosulfate sulfotransferase (PAPS reductase)/FAD synthetase
VSALEGRVERMEAALADSERIIAEAVETYSQGKTIVARALLYSGGNDSTTMGHIAVSRGWVDRAVHVNTGIGIAATREHVIATCAAWGLPLGIYSPPPGSTYRDMILDPKGGGFPGPAQHWKAYQRLKERSLDLARQDMFGGSRKRSLQVLLFAGRRRQESKRRANIEEFNRDGRAVWVSPLANWTNEDMNTYRALYDVPRNPVADLIHMSGECLCGAFAHANELDEIGEWFPEVKAEIQALEAEVHAAGLKHCTWGWGATKDLKPSDRSGPMCSSCVVTRQEALS